MDVLSILAVMQLLLVGMWFWLLVRTTRFAAELIELRARIAGMPTHQDLRALANEVAGVKANTDQTLRLVSTMHNAMMEIRR